MRLGRLMRAHLAVSVLACAVCAAGCAPKRVSTHFAYRTLRSITASGTIHTEGPPVGKLTVTATPAPEMKYHSGSYEMIETNGTAALGPYTLDGLAMEVEVTKTKRVSAYGMPRGQTVAKERVATRSYVIRVRSPAGWEAVPKEYLVSKDTKGLDFLLRPVAARKAGAPRSPKR